MKIFLQTSIFLFVFCTTSMATAQSSIAPEEFKELIGNWSGSLTYTNYSDGSSFSMPAELEIKTGKNNYQLRLFTSYPNEPKANSKGMLKLSKDGTQINNESITSIEKSANSVTQITTEYQGKDNRKNARIKNIYIFAKSRLIIRKEVKFEGAKNWILRNEYSYVR